MPFFPTDIENRSILPFNDADAQAEIQKHTPSSYRLPLSLDRLLISNAPSTFFARMEGEERDILIIDKSAAYDNNSLIVVYEDNEFKLRRLTIDDNGTRFLSREDAPPVALENGTELWGRVVYYIKAF